MYGNEIIEILDLEEAFRKRTLYHISLVQKYLDKIIKLNIPEINNKILEQEKNHDASKFGSDEREGYLYITKKYNLKSKRIEYKPGDKIENLMRIASFHHLKDNKHHPEYWDNSNSKIVDAANMPDEYVLSMVADWLAMSEELNNSAIEWADNNIGKKWEFTEKQKKLIYNVLNAIL
jgi:hypothetical protein